MGDPDNPDSRPSAAKASDEPPEFARLLTEDDGDATAPPTAMRDIEKSLVERIADVDDERRRTSTQVRKALSAHRDEVEQRLRHFRGLLTATLVTLALIACALTWLAMAALGERARLDQQVAEIQQQLQSSAATPIADAAPAQPDEDALAGLRQQAQAIASQVEALERALASSEQRLQRQFGTLADKLDARPAADSAPARDEQQALALAALEKRVDTVAGDLRSTKAALQSLADRPSPVQPSPVQPSPRPSPVLASADQPNAREPSEATDQASDLTTLAEPRIALQLIGYHSRGDVEQFIATHHLPSEIYLRSESYRGRPWYALIYGLYENAEAAGAARSALPDGLARLDIWLRELPAGTTLERVPTRATD